MRSFTKWALAALVLAIVAAPVLAQPITVAAGNDGWKTPANSSKVDLSVFPIDAFFGPGSVISPTVVLLSGVPLKPASLGSIDTLLERFAPSQTFASYPETHSFTVQIKGLRLKGTVKINGVTYDLVVALSETPSGPGTVNLTRLTPDGGRFSSSFIVLPKLVFTEVGNPSNQVVIDCATASCPSPMKLGASNVCWEVAHGPNNFDPATKGITPIAAGIAIDGTFNGVNDYTTVGRASTAGLEFHVGYDPAPPWGLCGGTGTFTHDHAVYSLTHVSTQPTDCPPTQTATAGAKAVAQPVPSYCVVKADPVPVGTVDTTPDGTVKN